MRWIATAVDPGDPEMSMEARALQLEQERTRKRLRSNLNAMRVELEKLDAAIADCTATSRGPAGCSPRR